MPKATNTHTTPPTPSPARRTMLTGASAAVLAGAAAVTAAHAAPAVPAGADGADDRPDAARIRLHLALVAQTAELRRLEAEADASTGDITPESEAQEVRMNAAERPLGSHRRTDHRAARARRGWRSGKGGGRIAAGA